MTPHDHAPSVPSQGEETAIKRSGSQKRRRGKCAAVWLTDEEYAEAETRAALAGLSISSYGRFLYLGTTGPRARRTKPVDAQVLGRCIAELNRAGNVVNQVARRLNAAQSVGGSEATAALAEIRAAARAVREAAGYRDHGNDNQGEPPQ
jgi:hypothetical protein